MEYLEWNFGALGGHEVGCVYGAESYGVVIGTFVTHNTDAAHVGKGCEVLTEAFDAGFGDLVAVDVVGVLNDADFFCRYFADDTDSKARTREWLAAYQIFRNAEFTAGFTNFVLEKETERFDDFFEINAVREPPTLWWDLMTADLPRPDSITSG